MIKSLPALCNQSVLAIVITLCLASPVWASDKLSPRGEVNVRAGTERSILMTEFWAPLAQQSDRVLYGDLRLMGDDSDNREGNLGFGYRQISTKTNSVLGGNIWIDRRRTENGNNFNQLTLGVESLGNTIDLRANGYIQLNGSKTRLTPNIGSATPYLAGSGIFFDTNGFVVEEPQDGFDAEIGYRLPIFQKYIDATRVYGGGYHFFGDLSDNTTGFRLRAEAQVNSIFSVGARFQHDDPRGSQGFLEATLRFPFKSKKLYQEYGLRSRLDESPERDIDIVTGSKVDNGLAKPVLNTASNQYQRVLHVDNTAQANGNGTKESPFNTLAAAQAVLADSDIIYIHHGDGTTMGQNQGIAINKNNVQLIGSGTDFIFDRNKFTTYRSGQLPASGTVIAAATSAPVITNTEAFVDDGNGTFTSNSGNGVFVTGNNISIAGITVSGSVGSGIYVLADGSNTVFDTVAIRDVNANSSQNGRGILVFARNGATIDNVIVTDSLTSSNLGTRGHGVEIRSQISNSKVNTATVDNINTNGNAGYGIIALATVNGQMNTVNFSNNIATANNTVGIYTQVTSTSQINTVTISNNTVSANNNYGIYAQSSIDSQIGNLTINNNSSSGNSSIGIFAQALTNSQIDAVMINNNNSSGNGLQGIYVYSTNSNSQINSATVSNNVVNNNNDTGIILRANDGAINQAVVSENDSRGNRLYGLYFFTQTAASTINQVTVQNNTVTANRSNGVYAQKGASSVFAIDLGGGAWNSTGQNRIFNNLGTEIRVDAGYALSAQTNYWGGGDLAGGERTLNGGSTIDTTGHLAIDPNP